MSRRIAVRAIITHNGKLLAVKLKPYEAKLDGNYWCLVGGTVDDGEPLLPALTREVIEETGVTPEIGNLLFVQQFGDEKKEHMEFFFHVTNGKDFLDIDLNDTTHGEQEIAEIDFIYASKVTILPDFLTNVDYENLENQAVKFFSYLS